MPASQSPNITPPQSDAQIPAWIEDLGIPGIIDLHVHFMPDPVQQKVWRFFDQLARNGEPEWPVSYRQSDGQRLHILRTMGVRAFTTLNYAHRPGMAQWLNAYSTELARQHPDVVHSATFFPEPEAESTVDAALTAGAQVFKIHIQVGGFSPLDPQLDAAWARVAQAGAPVVIHCGRGPHPGAYTGIDPIPELLRRHPGLVLIIAHGGLPDYLEFAELASIHPHVYLDTTMVGTAYMEQLAPMPAEYPNRLAELADKVVFGSDFPTIPHSYSHQLQVLNEWGLGPEWLAGALWHTPQKLLDP